ncbi:peptidoglycan-binding protein [Intestinibacillus massiliensis]|nr:peptidoglycan-binding protein [Intestinibacillus massiliensis]
MPDARTPVIPDFITVHLGVPDDRSAPNVTVSFPDYIKNVASSEIYPTWPENAIRANIYAQISYALNRVYTEWYRSRGYNFDITNSTRYDQSFMQGREIFENIGQIVDELFRDYLVRPGSVEPLFAQYCNGTTVTCEGLSQWGTVPLAEQGMTPYEILTHFYGPDLNIVRDAPVAEPIPSYPGSPLRRGMSGNAVRDIQVRLNRISNNYPAIPKIYPVNGFFDLTTENAVKEFQRLFNLTQDGVVGSATWYRIAYIFTSVKRLAELDSEGLSLADVSKQFPAVLREGDTAIGVRVVQYFLSVVSQYVDTVPAVPITGVYGPETTASVRAFQQLAGLPVDGVVGPQTWNLLYQAYSGILEAVPNALTQGGVPLFPGTVLARGSTGDDVTLMQEYLNFIAGSYPEINNFPVTGYFGDQTSQAVLAFQQLFGLEPDGVIGAVTWDAIASVYSDLKKGFQVQPGQYPGYELGEGV